MDNLTGRTIKGYELREQLGAGGFGAVYRAYQSLFGSTGREVAIKVILPQFANHPDFIRRFEVEAQLVARLEHPFIVPLYDYWREPDGAFLVMRYLPTSLRDRLKYGALSLPETGQIVDQIAAALTVAHRGGVVHRDLKPANVLLDSEGNAYLADFGIAKILVDTQPSTEAGKIIGSFAYVSPEQIKDEPITACADIYAFGILIYEALTGHYPFSAELTPSALLYKHLHEPLPLLQENYRGVPATLDRVIQQATAKDLAQRTPTALNVAAAFRKAVRSLEEAPIYERSTSIGIPAEADAEEKTTPLSITPPTLGNPYKGLRAFRQADAPDFFGRSALTERLLSRFAEDHPMARFLAIVGPSGSGKSSVAHAGLLPALQSGALPGSENWFIAEMMPGTCPLDELEIALLRVAARQPSNLAEQIQRDTNGLIRAARLILPADGELLLLVDQSEELFMLAENPAHARHFMDLLYAAITEPRCPVRVVITLRADFYDRPLVIPGFSELMRQRTEVIVPLTPTELERAIVGPAERIGVRVEPRLVAAIVGEVGEQPGALPMLQYALTELFERRSDHTLTLSAYQRLGGVMGVLAQRADEVYRKLTAEQQAAARQIFLRLITLGEGTEDTRRRAKQSELYAIRSAAVPAVLDAFGQSRLLSFDRDPATREPTVEVAHEALIREWRQLRIWLNDSRDDVRLQRHLSTAAAEWEECGRDPSYLLTGSRLAQFETWMQTTDLALNPESEIAFINESIRAEAAEKAEEIRIARQVQNFRRVTVILATVFLLALMASIVAALAAQRARHDQASARAQEAEARQLQATTEWQATYFAVVQGRAQTLVAGVGMMPVVTQTQEPQAMIATTTKMAELTQWQPVVQDFDGVDMVMVPAGCFVMGSIKGMDAAPFEICFDAPYWIDRYEVSNAQFDQFGGLAEMPTGWADPGQPRTNISWFEANAYCQARSADGQTRLPTEPEWEYAARGPDSLVFPWGNEFAPSYAVFGGNSAGPAAVDSFPEGVSWIGAYHMSGNAWEWVSTIYRSYPYSASDGREDGADTSSPRVFRGHSFSNSMQDLNLAIRNRVIPSYNKDLTIGFRCARSD